MFSNVNQIQLEYHLCPDLMSARSADLATKPEQTLKLYERAIKNNPKNIMVLQEACDIFVQRYELRKAHSCIERILKLGQHRHPQVLFIAGQLNLRAYRPKQAEECFKKAAKAKLPSANSLIELSALLEKNGHYDTAKEHIQAALQQEPKNGIALRLQAHLSHKSGEAELAEKQFQQLALDERQDSFIRAQALNGWAHLLDQEEQYDLAYEKLMESKSLQLAQNGVRQIKQHYKNEYAFLHKIVDSVDANSFTHLADWEPRHSPNYLLTGCPRSGTTLIEKILDSHPDVISADEYNVLTSYSFPDFFKNHLNSDRTFSMNELSSITDSVKQKETNKYRKALELAMGEKIGKRQLIDKNPGLSGLIPALLSMMPQTKILYAIRDPRDIALSALFRWLPLNTASYSYLAPSSTCSHIAQELNFWFKLRPLLPSGSWKETRYENTVTNYQAEGATLLEWMQLESEEYLSDYLAQLNRRGVNSPTYFEVSQPVHQRSVDKWKHYQDKLEPYFEKLTPTIERLAYTS